MKLKLQGILGVDYQAVAMVFMGWFLRSVCASSLVFDWQGIGFQFCTRFSSVLALALGMHSSAAVPRPAASSFMPLRCAHQAPELRSGMVGGYNG
jgi:hypothetical protein